MKIKRLDPAGLIKREIEGVTALESLPDQWFGYSNIHLRFGGASQPAEIDVIFVTYNRIFIVDLKDWKGNISSRNGIWYQNGREQGKSAALKLAMHAKRFATLLRDRCELADPPFVEYRVVFMDRANISDLDPQEIANNTVKLAEFLHSLKGDNYQRNFRDGQGLWGKHRPLTEGEPRKILSRFFGDRETFKPRQITFGGYRPQDMPDFQHPRGAYSEYECEYSDEPDYRALLRYWDFSALPNETHLESERRALASREQKVLAMLKRADDDLYDRGVLKWKDHDREFKMQYWELFELTRATRRLREYLSAVSLTHADKIDLASKLLARVSQLHRHQIAHRDIRPEAIWIDQARSNVILSSFACAYYPATTSLREMRLSLLAASTKLPEDDETLGVSPGTPFQQDVFLLGALTWTILSSIPLATSDNISYFESSDSTKPLPHPELHSWFRKALELDPTLRWPTAIAMHDSFLDIVRQRDSRPSVKTSLAAYERKNPYIRYPLGELIKEEPNTVYFSAIEGSPVVVKIWPIAHASDSETETKMRNFFAHAEKLRASSFGHVQSIADFGFHQTNLYLVTKVVDGTPLREIRSADLTLRQAYDICEQLVRAVESLHAKDLSHGDLNEENILVTPSQDSFHLSLIDLPEYTPNGYTETHTPAFSPPTPSDSSTRDRFAVCKLVKDLLNPHSSQMGENGHARRLLSAVAECEAVAAPWLTLQPVIRALDTARSISAIPRLTLNVGTQTFMEAGTLQAIDDSFHVIISEQENALSIVGLNARLQLTYDPKKMSAVSVLLKECTDAFQNFAAQHSIFRFRGEVAYHKADRIAISDFNDILSVNSVAEVLKTIRDAHSVRNDSTPEPKVDRVESLEPTHQNFNALDVETLWKKIIEIEEEDVVDVTVTKIASFDSTRNAFVVPCEYSRTDIDFESDERAIVYQDGYRIGDLDVDLMTASTIGIRNLKRSIPPSVGTRLTIATAADMDNLTRRKNAIERILADKSIIPKLTSYFAPSAVVEPDVVREDEIPAEALDHYRLDESQKLAFRKLWKFGPVGLLQGPPGTGKTSFIAAFIHYAITQGGVNNVLLLSQSHKAVDNAIERLLTEFQEQPVSLLRIGQLSKVSARVANFHSRAVHEQIHMLFAAETKQRITRLAKELGLPETFAADAFECWTIIRAYQAFLSDASAEDDENEIIRDQFTAAQHYVETFKARVGIDPAATIPELLDLFLPELAKLPEYDITNPRLIQKFRQLLNISADWGDALDGDRTLEAFLVKSRQIVSGTCVGVGHRRLRVDEVDFDLVLIDEAAKCSPGDLAIGMQVAKRVILVGDHKQLPPFQDRAQFAKLQRELGTGLLLSQTDFQRALSSSYGSKVGSALSTQYRMTPAIGALVSSCFYDSSLKTARAESPIYFDHLPDPFHRPITWINTADAGHAALEVAQGTSFQNTAEISSIIRSLRILERQSAFWSQYNADYKTDAHPIGVICLYAAQSTQLRRELLLSGLSSDFQELVKVDTVDSYQGAENPIIMLSLVRNNMHGSLTKHAGDLRRINVAVSRAMERLIIFGSLPFFSKEDPNNSVRTVIQYILGEHPESIISSAEIRLREDV